MADKGIIFSAPMVRALLEGRKTQTRRLLKRSLPPSDASQVHTWFAPPDVPAQGIQNVWAESGLWAKKAGNAGYIRYCGPLPYRPGDRLYVREAWHAARSLDDTAPCDIPLDADIEHAATARNYAEIGLKGRLRPSIHMPRWASRLWLEVTGVRVERIQDIGSVEAEAEGIDQHPIARGWKHYGSPDLWCAAPETSFETLWDMLHGSLGERWQDNPWIVAITFKVHHGNIDAGSE